MLLNCEQCCGFFTSLLGSVAGAMAESKMNFAPNNKTQTSFTWIALWMVLFSTKELRQYCHIRTFITRLEFSSHVILVVENEETL